MLATGQDDNLGDVVLRRRMLQAARAAGRLHVFVGHASADFVDGLDLANSDSVYTNYRQWLIACTCAMFFRRALLLHNAGEIVGNWHTFKRRLSLLPATFAGRLRSNPSMCIAAGARLDGSRWLARIRVVLLPVHPVVWRDADTQGFFRSGNVGPDWAFDAEGHHASTSTQRDRLLVSLRGDRAFPEDQWFEAIQSYARTAGLEVVVYSQVRRDETRSAEVAQRLGASHVQWPDARSHRAHENVVRDLLRSASILVSDRLHALIFGCYEGALPASFVCTADIKVGRTLHAAGIHGVSVDTSGMTTLQIADLFALLASRREEVNLAVAKAQEQVRDYEKLLLSR